MERLTFRRLVCRDLGYCCPAFFLRQFPETHLVAARLGISDRAVRYQKEALAQGFLDCENSPTCLQKKLLLPAENASPDNLDNPPPPEPPSEG